jgi:hypothetical protein
MQKKQTKSNVYYSHHYQPVLLQQVLALKGPSLGSTTDTSSHPDQQNVLSQQSVVVAVKMYHSYSLQMAL